jgi:hypothetical protein
VATSFATSSVSHDDADPSEIVEEVDDPVGRAVAAGTEVRGRDAVQGALLELQVGVEVDVRGSFLLVSEPQRDAWKYPGCGFSADTERS